MECAITYTEDHGFLAQSMTSVSDVYSSISSLKNNVSAQVTYVFDTEDYRIVKIAFKYDSSDLKSVLEFVSRQQRFIDFIICNFAFKIKQRNFSNEQVGPSSGAQLLIMYVESPVFAETLQAELTE